MYLVELRYYYPFQNVKQWPSCLHNASFLLATITTFLTPTCYARCTHSLRHAKCECVHCIVFARCLGRESVFWVCGTCLVSSGRKAGMYTLAPLVSRQLFYVTTFPTICDLLSSNNMWSIENCLIARIQTTHIHLDEHPHLKWFRHCIQSVVQWYHMKWIQVNYCLFCTIYTDVFCLVISLSICSFHALFLFKNHEISSKLQMFYLIVKWTQCCLCSHILGSSSWIIFYLI